VDFPRQVIMPVDQRRLLEDAGDSRVQITGRCRGGDSIQDWQLQKQQEGE
jgi:hypothetical protein